MSVGEETRIKLEIREYLGSLGAACWHVAYHSVGYGRKGVPDRLVCYRGRFIGIEVKASEKHKATPWQEREKNSIIAAQGKSVVVWSVEQVRELIRAIDVEFSPLA